MLPIFNKFLIFFLYSNLIYSSEFKCTEGKIEQISFGKTITETSSYCYNPSKTNLLSLHCYKTHCEQKLSDKKYKIDELLSTIGNPGFNLCRKLNGNPEIITFFVAKTAYKLDRCIFSKENYVDTDYLLSLYLAR